MNYIYCAIAGNLTAKPELRHTKEGKAVTNFNLATNIYRKDNDPIAEFNRVVVWGRNAENVCKFKDKGDSLFVAGTLSTNSWEDKEGVKRQTKEVIAHTVQFGQNKRGSDVSNTDSVDHVPPAAETPSLDDIPF